MIELTEALLRAVISHAREMVPEEACGWLAGKEGKVLWTYPVPNVAKDRRSRFLMDPEAQLAAMREIRERGLDLTGTYHSHPRSAPYPSAKDRELALYPDCAHLIVSLMGPEPEVRCWRVTQTGFDSLELSSGHGPPEEPHSG